jgi:hypothetical protein
MLLWREGGAPAGVLGSQVSVLGEGRRDRRGRRRRGGGKESFALLLVLSERKGEEGEG